MSDVNQYTDIIRQWATDTRRAGVLPGADGTGEVGLESSQAGSRLAVRFALKVEFDRVTDARYQVFGCGFSMAACAVAADMTVGYRLSDVMNIDAERLDVALDGLPAGRRYCADLATKALHAAVQSAIGDQSLIEISMPGAKEHGPRITAGHPVYAALMRSRKPAHISDEDRHLFACLLSVAITEPYETAAALGLDDSDVTSLLMLCFPEINLQAFDRHAFPVTESPPASNDEVLSLLYSHVPAGLGFNALIVSCCLARILAARAAFPGHLWVAMGLTERSQLTAAIRRHLPSLAEANNQNMRWKRYLYKQVCDLNGGTMCKAPNCGVCSDYSLCFAAEP